ncbi:diacylglycerol/lipid kinase family protein [Spirilliplanes yamanashiensis]|nr:diacylglycerol kinase family protein [Spirilliplanes yamanashiensis]
MIAVLANPAAGRGRHRGLLPGVLDRLGAAGATVELLTAASAGEAEAACHAAVRGGARAVVAVGGDGTVHRALQAVAGSDVAFGIVPAGTGNDIAAAAGLPPDPLSAASALAEALRDGRTHPLDLARVTTAHGGTRWFGGVLAAGFDAVVNERANRLRWPRGPRRYDLAIAVELARLRPRAYTLTLDGAEHRLPAVLVAVCNTASYGGGIRIGPGADPADGLLDVVVGAPMSRRTLARLTPHVHRGTHVGDPLVTVHRAREVTVAADGIVGYADGERLAALPLTVTCVPGALRLLV